MKSKPKKNYDVISRASMIQKLENNTKSSCFSSTSQEGTNDTFTIPKNEIRKTKGRNLSQDNSINMLSGFNDKEKLFTFSNDDIPDENMEWDYSELMSRLSIWDKNYIKNNNRKSAPHNYNQDIFKSEIGKHINQLAGFEKIGSLSSFRSNVFNNQLKPLKINDNTQSNINSNRINYNNQIIKPKYKSNFNFDVFKKKQSLIAPKEEKEIEGKNDNKEMLTMTSMPNIHTQTNNNIDMNFNRQIGMGDNTEIQPENEHRLMQEREKEKIENYNREELIKSYKMLSILYIKKGKYKEIIDDTYKLLNEIKKDYLAHTEALKNQKNQMFQKYSSPTKYKSNSQLNYILNSYSNTDKVGIEEMYLRELKKKNFEARDDKLKNYQLYYEVIKRIEEKERKCDQEYMIINNELLNIIMQNTEEIYKINNRYREYNKRYEALKKDQTLYYSNLLKQGVDTKNEGLSWILKRLLELNIDINTLQFPSFLNKKQVDYLINVSKLSYQIHQLNIVLKELKLRQNRISNEDKKKLLETIDSYATKRENINSNNYNKDNNPKREMIKSSSAKLVEFKNKSFFNLLEQKQSMYRNHLNYKEEENKIKRITQSIKNSLKQYTSTGHQIYSSHGHADSSQIDFIYNSNKSMEYIDNINILRKRLNEISNAMNNIVKEQQAIFKVKYSSYSNNPMLENAIEYYEQIKKALFGSKQVLYIN